MATKQDTKQDAKQDTKQDAKQVLTDFKSALKHKKIIMLYISKHIKRYQTATITITEHAKNHIIYIYFKFVRMVINFIKRNVDIDAISPKYTMNKIEQYLDTCSTSYRMCNFIKGVIGDRSLYIEEEDVIDTKINKILKLDIPYAVDAILIFFRAVAKAIANVAWAGSMRITDITMNGILRNMDRNDINPVLFQRMHELTPPH